MKWSKALDVIEEDPRFTAVDSERLREELFDDFMQEMEKKEREDRRAKRRETMAAFRAHLEGTAAMGHRTVPRWHSTCVKTLDLKSSILPPTWA